MATHDFISDVPCAEKRERRPGPRVPDAGSPASWRRTRDVGAAAPGSRCRCRGTGCPRPSVELWILPDMLPIFMGEVTVLASEALSGTMQVRFVARQPFATGFGRAPLASAASPEPRGRADAVTTSRWGSSCERVGRVLARLTRVP